MTDRSIRDVIARYLSGDARFQPTPGDYTDADEMLALLDIHDDAILDRDCETCGSNEPDAPWIQNCPDCDGTGREPVAKVMVVPICVCGQNGTLSVHHRSDGPCYHVDNGMTADDERALHIGGAVMASQPKSAAIHSFFTKVVSVDLTAVGWNNARAEFLAAGEVEG